MISPADDLELISRAARDAGKIAMRFFGAKNDVWSKHGNSPVSEADYAVDAYLKEVLLQARPDYGWLSEETEDNADRLQARHLFVVDPIDGTRGFLEGRSEWCVSIGIVVENQPVAGVLECPALDEHFTAVQSGGAFLNGSRLPLLRGDTLKTLTGSRKLNEIMETQIGNRFSVTPFVPSLAYRVAMVAGNRLDGALARPGAHDWDLAAADIILREAGGLLTDLEGKERLYNQPNSGSGSLLASAQGAHKKLIDLAKSGGFLH